MWVGLSLWVVLRNGVILFNWAGSALSFRASGFVWPWGDHSSLDYLGSSADSPWSVWLSQWVVLDCHGGLGRPIRADWAGP